MWSIVESLQILVLSRSEIFVFLQVSNELLHTDICRHILECRFTHFASYVVVEISRKTNIWKQRMYLGTEEYACSIVLFAILNEFYNCKEH